VFWVIGLSISVELLQAVTEQANELFDLAPKVRQIAFIIIIAMFLTPVYLLHGEKSDRRLAHA